MTAATNSERVFYSVADAAELLGMCDMTLYRAIRDGQFPAVRIRGRLIIPARVIDAIAAAALETGALVDAADWVVKSPPGPEPPSGRGPQTAGRPRPGANQTGAGSFSTQHMAGYGEDATPGRSTRRRGGAA